MRSLLVVLFVAGLLVSPALAVIKVAITADGATAGAVHNALCVCPGQTVTIKVVAGADATGIVAICGYVGADATSTANMLTTVPGSWTWGPQWQGYTHVDPLEPMDEYGNPIYDLNFANYELGVKMDGLSAPATFSGSNGGYGTSTKFMGSVRLDPNRNPLNVGIYPDMVLVASYQVRVNPTAAPGSFFRLVWRDKGAASPLGYRTDSSTGGQTTDFTVSLWSIPEPTTMALLTFGGLVVAQRAGHKRYQRHRESGTAIETGDRLY